MDARIKLAQLLARLKMARMSNKGVAGTLIGILIAVIVGAAVTIPVTYSVLNTAGLNETARTLGLLLPTLIITVLIVAIVGSMGIGTGKGR